MPQYIGMYSSSIGLIPVSCNGAPHTQKRSGKYTTFY